MFSIKKIFSRKNSKIEYTKFELWISDILDVPIKDVLRSRYYIKEGTWYIHEDFYMDGRTTYDNISHWNEIDNTYKIRPATEEEIKQYENFR